MLQIFQEQRNQGRPNTVQAASASPARDQRVIGQFNNVVASLNTTSQPELANTLKLLKEAIIASTQITSYKKQELIEIINEVGDKATRIIPIPPSCALSAMACSKRY